MPVMTPSLYALGSLSGQQKFFDNGIQDMSTQSAEESDCELEFLASGGNSSGLLAPFQPQRCSTPLQRSTTASTGSPSFGEYSRTIAMQGGGNDRLCASNGDFQASGDFRAIRKVATISSNAGLRCLPVHSASPVFSHKAMNFGMVPDYSGSSSSFSSAGAGEERDGSPFRDVYSACSGGNDYRPMACCTSSSSGSPLVNDFIRASGGGVRSVHGMGGEGSGRGSPAGSLGRADNRWTTEGSVERQAQAYRLAASICVPNVVWSGILPARCSKGSAYSCKVFLGGVPWDITEANLNAAFGKFGQLKVEWPSSHSEHAGRNSKGYLYIIFDNERSVRSLLQACTQDLSQNNRNYYFKVCSNRLRRKDVQVIPWQLADSNYVRNGCISAFGTKTVFVGSLHGMLNAEGLARIMDDLFGGVVAANVDTDKHKYPIGSGRVVFNCTHSYVKAIRAAFVELRTQKFSKKIQIDPFLEDSMCSICNAQVGPFFCRDMECFQYFCGTCWQWQHSVDNLKQHTPMMRNPRSHDADY